MAFRERLGARAFAPELDATVDEVLVAARVVGPGFAIDEARFAARLADLVPAEAAPLDALAQLNVPELYLCFACAEGLADALALLDREYFAELRPALSKMGLTASAIDETLQVMREELLAPRPDAAPRILSYSGRGQLRGWLRAVAARTGLRTIGQPHRQEELDERKHAPTEGDLELEYMKKTYGEAFQRAFTAALAAIPAEDRLLLKQRFRHQLTVEELGAMHSVHAGTISRWVAAARERLVKATRVEMMRELGVDRAEVSSILRLIESQMEITLSSHSA